MNGKQRQPKPHVHELAAYPAGEAKRLPAPPNHPAFQPPMPMPVWKCEVKYCEFETWSSPWFRR